VDIRDPGIAPPPGLTEAVQSLVGRIQLQVPKFSAVKVDGQPLYRASREGRDVTPPERTMHVHSLSADATGWPWVTLEMKVAGGTYVRAIVEALGARVGMPAHVASLRRTQVGAWTLDRACPLAEYLAGRAGQQSFVPLTSALALPTLALDAANREHVVHGRMPQRVHRSATDSLEPGVPFLFVDLEDNALAVAQTDEVWKDLTQPPRCHFERVLEKPE
jgi:tRNA pseudouridine55 synthase